MIILDFYCKNCGNQEDEVVVKNGEELVSCKICGEQMDRLFTRTKYSFRPSSGTPVPPSILGGGERANFGISK